jgi:hypothetical protein
MKQTFLYLTVLLLSSFSNNLIGQQLCHTPAQTNNNFLNKSAYLRTTNNSNSYCLKVYFHVIRRSDGTGGQPTTAVNQAFQILNQDYNPHNISFSWDLSIDYIDNTTYYNDPNYGSGYEVINGEVVFIYPDIFSVNNHQDGIDIYLFDDSVGGGGLAHDVGYSSEFYVTGSFWEAPNDPLVTSHIISHEMGHVLFLWHTHHGTYPEGGNDNPCPELVNGSNSSTCGDYVTDTPADPHIHFNVNPACQWQGSGTDANGDSYNPDEKNIMSYSTPQCMSYFTPLQGLRMRNSIATLPYLQQTIEICCNEPLDLYVKDSPDDDGTEPNTITQHMWTSQDVWVRNDDDGGLTHQNPEYKAPIPPFNTIPPNYIYVRVINKSDCSSSGNETLTVNWAKANTALTWPQNWDGSIQNSSGFDLGGELNPANIPLLQVGEEAIVVIPWEVPNPENYTSGQGSDNPHHFCLLARIDATDDPLSYPMTANPNEMVRNNNNLAWKNLTVVDLETETSAAVFIANPSNTARTFRLILQKDANEQGKAVYDEAEVTLTMDDLLYNAWVEGGEQSQSLDPTLEEKSKLVKGDNVNLDNIAFEANEMGLLTLDFKFLTEELTEKTEYTYHIIQKDADTGDIIGGETYVVKKQTRPMFLADAGEDKEVDLNETITISAEDINEPAIYNWYDSEGNLVYQGKDLTVTADVVKEFKLEVIATTDGFKDYAEVEVKFKPSTIESITPNPATENVAVNYKINGASSAYLMVIGYYGSNESNNYILDTTLQQTQINVSTYPIGYYTVALICDGEIVDAKTLIKQ